VGRVLRSLVQPVRLGVVGCGSVARRRHLPALRSLRELEVVALADTDEARCERLADDFGVARRCRSVDELLESPDVEAVAVLTPASAHADVALTALQAGKSVFVEKPLALSLGECDALVEAAEQSSSATVMVGYNLRWHSLVRRARAMLQDGAIGRVTAVATAFTDPHLTRPELPEWRARRDLGGGTVLEKLVHHFDLWRFLLDDEVDDVLALASSGRTDDEVTAVSARMREGALVQALASDLTSATNVVALYGEGGTLRLDMLRFDGLEHTRLHDYPGAPRLRARRLLGQAAQFATGLGEVRRGGLFAATYANEWRQFALAHREGRRQPGASFEDGRRAFQVALAAGQSAALGRSVSVDAAAETAAEAT
jgi:predicted dehydrogenase